MLLEGKVAIVTGSAAGYGTETLELFAKEGAKVVGCDVVDDAGEAIAERIRSEGGDASYLHADVRSRADLETVVAYAEKQHGRLDIMIANAGILGRASFRPSEEISDEDWMHVLDVNLSGVFRSFCAAIPALRRAGGGAMSATSSLSGVFGTLQRAAYSASKGGINALVRSFAVEYAPDRIRVNAVTGALSGGTGVEHNIVASTGRSRDELAPNRVDNRKWKERMLWQDDGTSSVAKAHLVVCSELGNYISGETLICDNGFSMWNGL